MKVIITGTTGYVGNGVLLSCLDNPKITEVLSVSRRSVGIQHPKLKEYLVKDFIDIPQDAPQLQGYDAVFFCLGMSSAGTPKDVYSHTCYEIPVHFAKCLTDKQKMHFIYVTGGGADVRPESKIFWAHVKGMTEHDLSQMGFAGSYGFRVGIMRPHPQQKVGGKMITSSKIFYPLLRPFNMGNTIEEVAAAMIACAEGKCDHSVVTVRDIRQLAKE